MTFLVNQTKSYTLAISKETGELRLELSDDLKENLTEMAAEADTNADMFAGVLDLMGEDAAEYLAAMGELMGVGGTLADAYANGGTGAVIEAIAGIKGDAFADAHSAMDRAAESNLFDTFAEIPGSSMSDITGYGQPSGDPFAKEGSEEGNDAIEDILAAEQGQISAPWWVGPAVLIVVGVAVVVVDELTAEPAAKVNDKDNGGFLGEVKFGNDDDEMPVDPDDPGFNFAEWLERPWAEESLDPTFGETLPADPDSEHYTDAHTKDYDPEAELDGVVMWDKDHVEDAITAAEVKDAAEFDIVSTTMPVEPDFEFKTDFGGAPDTGHGDDFGQGDAMATATEYIIMVADSDTMIFDASTQSGVVEAEGTSGAVLDGQIADAEAGAQVYDAFL